MMLRSYLFDCRESAVSQREREKQGCSQDSQKGGSPLLDFLYPAFDTDSRASTQHAPTPTIFLAVTRPHTQIQLAMAMKDVTFIGSKSLDEMLGLRLWLRRWREA